MFGDRYWSGRVTKYNPETGWYKVTYAEDADSEDMSENQVRKHMKIPSAPSVSKRPRPLKPKDTANNATAAALVQDAVSKTLQTMPLSAAKFAELEDKLEALQRDLTETKAEVSTLLQEVNQSKDESQSFKDKLEETHKCCMDLVKRLEGASPEE